MGQEPTYCILTATSLISLGPLLSARQCAIKIVKWPEHANGPKKTYCSNLYQVSFPSAHCFLMTANVSLGEQHPKLIFLRCSNLLCVVAVHCALMFRLFRLSFGQQLCWSPGLTTSPQTVDTSTPPARTVPSVTRNFQILITGTAPTTCHNMSQRLSFDASAGAE
jgi:hypothetical protein